MQQDRQRRSPSKMWQVPTIWNVTTQLTLHARWDQVQLTIKQFLPRLGASFYVTTPITLRKPFRATTRRTAAAAIPVCRQGSTRSVQGTAFNIRFSPSVFKEGASRRASHANKNVDHCTSKLISSASRREETNSSLQIK